MRISGGDGDFKAKAISGTHTILIALDCPEPRRKGLKGFAFQREIVGPNGRGAKFLRSQKVFKSVVPDPKNAHDLADPTRPARFYTDKFPVQSFLWGDYAAAPDTLYRFVVQPMYGAPGALTTDPADEIKFKITTEKEWNDGETHGVWFNRGAIAGQKFAEEFGNKPPQNINDPNDPTVKWLSRGLLEACLEYITETKAGDALRVAAYEFTYPPILNALNALIKKGLDVQIVYHDTTDADGKPNETAMALAGLPINDRKITYKRSLTKIPHNKFIVRLKGGTEPVEAWTGSTNFTPSGFLGQTNVGHRIADAETAQNYMAFWELVKTDPDLATARARTAALTPDPIEAIKEKGVARLFSPRHKSLMLGWYGRRILNAANSVWFTAAFGISKELIEPIAQKRRQMRFVLLEKPVPDAQKKALTADFNRVILSYGTPLGEIYKMKDGKPTARIPIKEFELDKWFFEEEHFRLKNDGFVFFVHTNFLLIDPLSDDPLVFASDFGLAARQGGPGLRQVRRRDHRIADPARHACAARNRIAMRRLHRARRLMRPLSARRISAPLSSSRASSLRSSFDAFFSFTAFFLALPAVFSSVFFLAVFFFAACFFAAFFFFAVFSDGFGPGFPRPPSPAFRTRLRLAARRT